jgi:hypothetical protein
VEKKDHSDGIQNFAHSEARNGTEFRGKNSFPEQPKNDLSVPQKSSFLAIFFLICGCRVLLSGTLLPGGLFPARITQNSKVQK